MTSVLSPGLCGGRRTKRMTQVDLARAVGLRPETLCRLEKQRQDAGLASAQRIADVLRVPAGRLTLNMRLFNSPRRQFTEQACTDCGQTKPIEAFVPIRGTETGHYARCRDGCARRARERYWADSDERERQKARVRRNRAQRREATCQRSFGSGSGTLFVQM